MEMPFCPTTIFNFQNRLSKHFTETGENLLENIVDHLMEKQLKSLKIKTNIQKTGLSATASKYKKLHPLATAGETTAMHLEGSL